MRCIHCLEIGEKWEGRALYGKDICTVIGIAHKYENRFYLLNKDWVIKVGFVNGSTTDTLIEDCLQVLYIRDGFGVSLSETALLLGKEP